MFSRALRNGRAAISVASRVFLTRSSVLQYCAPIASSVNIFDQRRTFFIRTTPDPFSLVFYPGKSVMKEGIAEFPDPRTSKNSPLAKLLFELNGVQKVVLGADFVQVTKSPKISWDGLRPNIKAILEDFYDSSEQKSILNATSSFNYVLVVDATFTKDEDKTGIGMALFDTSGLKLKEAIKLEYCENTCLLEVKAIVFAIRWFCKCFPNEKRLKVVSDCAEARQFLIGGIPKKQSEKYPENAVFNSLLTEFKEFTTNFKDLKLSRGTQRDTAAAHKLARAQFKKKNP